MTADKTTILWVSGSQEEARLGLSAAVHLEQRGIRTVFLTNQKRTYTQLASHHATAFLLDQICQPYQRLYHVEELAKWESQFPYPGFRLLQQADGTLRVLKADQALSLIAGYYAACLELFRRYQMNGLVMYPTAMVVGRIPFSIATALGLQRMVLQWGPLHRKTFVIEDMGEDWMWSELLVEDLSRLDEVAVEQSIEEVLFDDRVAVYPQSRSKMRRLASLLRHLKRSLRLVRHGFDFDTELARFEMRKEVRFLCRSLASRFVKYDRLEPSERYVLFPMHAHYDAALLSANPLFEDQVNLIRTLSRCLPVGYTLYVKEHPYDLGALAYKEVARLKALGNVKIINPEVKSIVLCRTAQAVVTLSGSVGWEAFCLQKPLIVLGRPFYSYSDLVYTVRDYTHLPEVLRRALTNGESIYRDRYEEYQRFLRQVLRTVCKGNVQGYKSNFGWPAEMQESNFQLIAQAIYEKLACRSLQSTADA